MIQRALYHCQQSKRARMWCGMPSICMVSARVAAFLSARDAKASRRRWDSGPTEGDTVHVHTG